MSDELKTKINWSCKFNNLSYEIIEGCLRIVEHTNIAYVEPHKVIIDDKLYIFSMKKTFLHRKFKEENPIVWIIRVHSNAKKDDKIFFIHECYINQEKKYFIDYWGYDSNIKMGTDGNYYITLENFSKCDMNSEVNFSLIKIN